MMSTTKNLIVTSIITLSMIGFAGVVSAAGSTVTPTPIKSSTKTTVTVTATPSASPSKTNTPTPTMTPAPVMEETKTETKCQDGPYGTQTCWTVVTKVTPPEKKVTYKAGAQENIMLGILAMLAFSTGGYIYAVRKA
jgi:hypothetical protein